jgi:hypothetical protein
MIDFGLLILIFIFFFVPLIILTYFWLEWNRENPVVNLIPHCKECGSIMKPTSQIRKSGDIVGMGITTSGNMVPVLGLGSDLDIILAQCPRCKRVVMLDKAQLRQRIKKEQIDRFGSKWQINV